MASTLDDFAAFAAAVAAFEPPEPDALDDDEVMRAQTIAASVGRQVAAWSAGFAAVIAERSARDRGYGGLAQRLGARTPERLVQQLTGVSLREAGSLMRVGGLMAPSAPERTPAAPWLVDVAAAVTAGALSVAAADAIRAGLGEPCEAVTAAELAEAAAALLSEDRTLSPETFGVLARDLRAELDLDGVRDREAAMRERRYLRFTQQGDGMTRVAGLLDPESAAIIVTAVDAALAPRRGPRFVDPADAAAAERVVNDPRTNDQLVVDAFVELTRIATHVDDGKVLGSHPPVVRIHVTDSDLRARRGLGRIQGQLDAISIATVERYICESGAIPILFDRSGEVLDVGRAQRTFTVRQRIALAARDGGCRYPGCDRPASWAEAHHITEWSHGGTTDIANGILLCRHHHMQLHNTGGRIEREGSEFFLVPGSSQDPQHRRTPMPSKSRTMQRALATAG